MHGPLAVERRAAGGEEPAADSVAAGGTVDGGAGGKAARRGSASATGRFLPASFVAALVTLPLALMLFERVFRG